MECSICSLAKPSSFLLNKLTSFFPEFATWSATETKWSGGVATRGALPLERGGDGNPFLIKNHLGNTFFFCDEYNFNNVLESSQPRRTP